MSAIVLLDTSILLNVLDVPGLNQNKEQVFDELNALIEQEDHLFIPMAAIFEAGNHIANLADGQVRRSAAQKFVGVIKAGLNGDAPWKPVNPPTIAEVLDWLEDFPDAAMAGLGMGDLSIKKEWQIQCQKFPLSRVRVWTLDGDLDGLDRLTH